MDYKKLIDKYCQKINEILVDPDTTQELSARIALFNFLEKILNHLCDEEIRLIHEGKNLTFGRPDYLVKKSHSIVGYIETKALSSDRIGLKHDQIKSFVDNLENIIVSDYCTFELYQNHNLVRTISLAKKNENSDVVPNYDSIMSFKGLIEKFLKEKTVRTIKSKQLAIELASRAKIIKNILINFEDHEELNSEEIFETFKYYTEYLKPGESFKEFVHNYVQSLVYGAFIAKIDSPTSILTRDTVARSLSSNQNLLKALYKHLSDETLTGQYIGWIIDDVINFLNNIDIKKIIDDFKYDKWQDDPIIHFYETFISFYDPNERQLRGIYYTPDPIVRYIINSVDKILKKQFFNMPLGLANKNVTLLDPAAGTCTFLIKAIQKSYENLVEAGMKGVSAEYLEKHTIPNFHAMELLLAPYTIAKLKISKILDDLVVESNKCNLYLTNTLSMGEVPETSLPFIKYLSKEARSALKVKKDLPILIIIGNPPYSVSSENSNHFINRLCDPYKDFGDKKEKNIRQLSNDYVKFIRWSEWKITKSGCGVGILGFITSNSYLDGVNHRIMRKHLLKTFQNIYILNLHGDSRIDRTDESGNSDENVFDIQEGVAIIIAIRNQSASELEFKSDKIKVLGDIFYREIVGSRIKKYLHLNNKCITNDEFKSLSPSEPHFLFVPKKGTDQSYTTIQLDDIFYSKYHGITTHRDHFLVSHSQEKLKKTIEKAAKNDELSSLEETKKLFNLKSTRDWDADEAILHLKRKGFIQEQIVSYSYRPFFKSYIYNNPRLIEYARPAMQNDISIPDNMILIVGRSGKNISGEWNLIYVTDELVDKNFFYRGGAYCFPMKYISLCTDKTPKYILNIKEDFLEKTNTISSGRKNHEILFFYIVGILHSKKYLQVFSHSLDQDFPPIPILNSYAFKYFSEWGKKICDLYLDRSNIPAKTLSVRFPVDGSNKILKISFQKNRLFINDTQFFSGISKSIWDYNHGGYNILEKYLKDLKKQNINVDLEVVNNINFAIQKIHAIQHCISQLSENDHFFKTSAAEGF